MGDFGLDYATEHVKAFRDVSRKRASNTPDNIACLRAKKEGGMRPAPACHLGVETTKWDQAPAFATLTMGSGLEACTIWLKYKR